MYPRTNYEMTPEDLRQILKACEPVPMIMLQCGTGHSRQERANAAWAELGSRMGFDSTTVLPTDKGDRFFTAVPNETEAQQKGRLSREAEAARLQEIETLKAEIRERQARLDVISEPPAEGEILPECRICAHYGHIAGNDDYGTCAKKVAVHVAVNAYCNRFVHK